MDADYRVLGIDLGGTNLRFGVVDPRGGLSHWHHEPVDWTLSGDGLVDWIVRRVESASCLPGVSAVAIGIAGTVLKGQVLKTDMVNLPALGDYPFSERMAARMALPCWMGNDADLALRGEVHFGAARGYKNVLLITLGTGIGGGLLLDGRLRYGPQGSVGEIGPMLLPIPSLAAPASIESLAAPGSIMKRLGDQKGRLFERLRQGDPLAARLAEEMFQAVGMTIANIHMLLGLELVLIFGGIASEGEALLEGFRREFARLCPPIYHYGLKIGFGSLPADAAGVIGAACHWFERQGLLPSLHYGE